MALVLVTCFFSRNSMPTTSFFIAARTRLNVVDFVWLLLMVFGMVVPLLCGGALHDLHVHLFRFSLSLLVSSQGSLLGSDDGSVAETPPYL